MIEKLKRSKEIKVHLESGRGHFVVENELTSFNLNEIDDIEVVNYIMMNAEQVKFSVDIKREGIFEYRIDNGYDYELNDYTSVFSNKFFNDEEFEEMCENAQTAIMTEVKSNKSYEIRDIYSIKRKLLQLYKNVLFDVEFGAFFCPSD